MGENQRNAGLKNEGLTRASAQSPERPQTEPRPTMRSESVKSVTICEGQLIEAIGAAER